MKITLLRHGKRDLTTSSDGSLNETGQKLALELPSRLEPQGKFPRPTHLICSPKRRARETLSPLSEHLAINLKTEPLLDERQNTEASVEFRDRVKNFFVNLPKQYTPQDVVYLCSHADWLEEAIISLPSDIPEVYAESGFACGEMKTFELNDGHWKFLKDQSG